MKQIKKVTPDLKKKTKKQAIDLEIDYRDYVALALEHYYKHVDYGEIEIDGEL